MADKRDKPVPIPLLPCEIDPELRARLIHDWEEKKVFATRRWLAQPYALGRQFDEKREKLMTTAPNETSKQPTDRHGPVKTRKVRLVEFFEVAE